MKWNSCKIEHLVSHNVSRYISLQDSNGVKILYV